MTKTREEKVEEMILRLIQAFLIVGKPEVNPNEAPYQWYFEGMSEEEKRKTQTKIEELTEKAQGEMNTRLRDFINKHENSLASLEDLFTNVGTENLKALYCVGDYVNLRTKELGTEIVQMLISKKFANDKMKKGKRKKNGN